jgi:hypothetical protein
MMDSPVVGAVASVEARLTSGLRCRRKHTATSRLKGQLALRVAHIVLGIEAMVYATALCGTSFHSLNQIDW